MTVIGNARVASCRVHEIAVAGVTYLAARFDVDVVSSGGILLGPVMDAIAAKVPAGATGRVHAFPAESVSPPCAVVAYPDEPVEIGLTFGRGADRATFPVFFIAGKPVERTARDVLSAVISGASSIADAIGGDLESA